MTLNFNLVLKAIKSFFNWVHDRASGLHMITTSFLETLFYLMCFSSKFCFSSQTLYLFIYVFFIPKSLTFSFPSSVAVPILVLWIFGVPFQRGFFCNDQSLIHQYREDTISLTVLVAVGICVPFITVS